MCGGPGLVAGPFEPAMLGRRDRGALLYEAIRYPDQSPNERLGSVTRIVDLDRKLDQGLG